MFLIRIITVIVSSIAKLGGRKFASSANYAQNTDTRLCTNAKTVAKMPYLIFALCTKELFVDVAIGHCKIASHSIRHCKMALHCTIFSAIWNSRTVQCSAVQFPVQYSIYGTIQYCTEYSTTVLSAITCSTVLYFSYSTSSKCIKYRFKKQSTVHCMQYRLYMLTIQLYSHTVQPVQYSAI